MYYKVCVEHFWYIYEKKRGKCKKRYYTLQKKITVNKYINCLYEISKFSEIGTIRHCGLDPQSPEI